MSRTIIIDDTDPGITYGGGTWTAASSPIYARSPEFMSTYHESHDLGATITYTFTGTKIIVWSSLNYPLRYHIPGATASIDGGTAVRFNATGDVPNFLTDNDFVISHVRFYTSPTLSSGQHTITITIDRVASIGPFFYFDYFTVETTPEIAQNAPNVIVDDGDTTSIQYGPAWVTQTGAYDEYLNSTHPTPAAINGTAVFKFQGTSIGVYATLNGQYSESFATFALDDRPVVVLGATTSSLAYHQQSFRADGLADNVEHKLTITAIMTQNVLPTWYLDYLVYTPSSKAITTNIDTSNQASSSPPTGAIVGGVLGGIAAAILLLFFFFWRRRRRSYGNISLTEGEKSPDPGMVNFYPMGNMSPGGGGGTTTSQSAGDTHNHGGSTPNSSGMLYRMAPAPMKGRLPPHQYQYQQAHGRQPSGSNMTDSMIPSAMTSSLPGLSNSMGRASTDAMQELEEEDRVQRAQGMAVTTLAARVRADGDVPLAAAAGVSGGGAAARARPPGATGERNELTKSASRTSLISRPFTGTGVSHPIQEVDAGVRLDAASDVDEDQVQDTLPPSYSRFR